MWQRTVKGIMYNVEEQALSEMKSTFAGGSVPEQIDDRIRQGMELAKRDLERRRRRKWRSLWTGIAAAFVVLVLAGSIRVSPAFAAFVRDIPGMDYFVKLIADDRGLQDAVANEWMQPVGLSDAHDGMRLTVDGIIADERRAVIFYTVKHENENENENFAVRLSDIRVLQGDRTPLHGILSYGYEDIGKTVGSKGEAGIRRGRVDVGLSAGDGSVLPDELIFSASLMAEDTRSYVPFDEKDRRAGDDLVGPEPRKASPSTNWEVRIKIDKAKFAAMKKVYPIGQTIDVQGHKLTFVQATVYPLQTVLEVKTDPSNRMKFLDFADLRLADEQGTALKSGNGSGGADVNQRFIYFESNYFDPPEHLYAEGELFRAWDTENSQVVIDLDREKLVSAPDDRLKLEKVSRSASVIQLHFSLTGIDEADNLIYSILNTEYTDGDGKTYSMSGQSGMSSASVSAGDRKQKISYVISNKPYKQPLTFQVYQYPGYLREKFRVQIK